jgi:hypothetical protein
MNTKTTLSSFFSLALVGAFLEPPPPSATENFYQWFFLGKDNNSIGGWIYFFLIALAAVIWVLFDSGKRKLPALGWRMAVVVMALLIFPTIIYRFTVPNLEALGIDPNTNWDEVAQILSTVSPLANYAEPIFYLGVLGGLLPVVLAIGYYVTFQGMMGCPRGMHGAYEVVLGQCPECARMDMPPAPIFMPSPGMGYSSPRGNAGGGESVAPPPPSKRKVQAWLVAGNGKSFQLCEHETTIGRMSSNDIYLMGDNTVSRMHAKIVEQGGHFKLYDLGSKGLTRVNGRTVREPVLLETDDEIRFGDNTTLRFKK